MYKELLKAVTNMGNPKVLLVGDFLIDSYVYGDALRISPEAPVQVLKVIDREFRCGGAGSVAVDLAALGAECICLGIVGDDPNGKKLTQMLDECGSDTSGLISIAGRPTISKERLIGLAQHRHRQQLLRIDEECDDDLTADQYEQILSVYKEKLDTVDVVCLQDYNKGVLSDGLCADMIKLAAGAGKKVLIDPAVSGDYSKYAGATLITPNRKESSAAVGFNIETIDDAKRGAEILFEKLDLEAIVITLDKEGAFLKTKDIAVHVPTVVRNVYDVTGAGDMVLATLATTIAGGCDYQTAVQLSNIAGGLEVEKFGATSVTIDEIVNEIIATNRGKTGKIHDVDTLSEMLQFHRQQNETIVFTNGCFDVLHRGHVEYLKFCKGHGDVVVVGLNSDSSVKQIKGPERPINNQYDRASVLAALETVDYVTIFDEPDPLRTIERVKPDVLVKGVDWKDKGVIGQDFVEAGGGKVVLAPMVEGKSSTSVINKIQSLKKYLTGVKKTQKKL